MNQLLRNALNLIRDDVHENAVAHGFHSFSETEKSSMASFIANMAGEGSELWEAFRKGILTQHCDKSPNMIIAGTIIDPRPQGYGPARRVTFLICWHLDTSTL